MNQRNMKLCLCRSCVNSFYKANCYRIFRANPLEVIKEPCDFCHVRRGYDFVIKPQKAPCTNPGLLPNICVAKTTSSLPY